LGEDRLIDIHTHLEFPSEDQIGTRLHIIPLDDQRVSDYLSIQEIIERVGLKAEYADYACRAVDLLSEIQQSQEIEKKDHPVESISLPIIGRAYTPYQHEAPYQPSSANFQDGNFYIQISPQFAYGLHALDTFSHIYILSYLNRSESFDLKVKPPWREKIETYGVFATRSPNRPNPIGLTRARLLRVTDDRIYTGPLDLFNETPILDIKPFIHSLDAEGYDQEEGNDGWLAGSEHLELHRLGIPHEHPLVGEKSEPFDLMVAMIIGTAWGLQELEVDLQRIQCTAPIDIGPEYQCDPSTRKVFELHQIPYQFGSDQSAIVFPLAAAILAALSPQVVSLDHFQYEITKRAIGLDQQARDRSYKPEGLSLCLIGSSIVQE
jgi:tRNA (adenine37-N6)-methyltransferase